MAEDELDAAIGRLYAGPLDRFVAERGKLAKALRSDGEKEAAKRVAKLAKPNVAAGALNRVAHDEDEAIGEWADATAALRDASARAGEVGGDAVREAMAAHRAATARVMDLVRHGEPRPSDAAVEQARAILQAATADAELEAQVRAGRATGLPTPAEEGDDSDGMADALAASLAAAPAKPRRRSSKRRAGTAPERDEAAEREAARKEELRGRVAAAEEEAERLQAEAEERDRVAGEAEDRRDEARRTFERTEKEAAAARQAADDARAAASAAQDDLRQARSLLRRAGG